MTRLYVLRNYRKSILYCTSVLGRLRDLQYIFAVIYETICRSVRSCSARSLPGRRQRRCRQSTRNGSGGWHIAVLSFQRIWSLVFSKIQIWIRPKLLREYKKWRLTRLTRWKIMKTIMTKTLERKKICSGSELYFRKTSRYELSSTQKSDPTFMVFEYIFWNKFPSNFKNVNPGLLLLILFVLRSMQAEMERRQKELQDAQETIRKLEDQLRETQVKPFSSFSVT